MANTTTATTTAVGELRHLDPATLVIDTNIRTIAALTKEFIASVGDGIRLPVLAVDTADGVLIRDGQRRTLAAREAGLATIPVYIVPAADGDEKAATAARIIDQMVANTHRTNLTRRDEVTAIEQLSLAGLSATKISKSVRASKKQVDHALATAASASALDAFETHGDLTLEQAATLAQYDDDPDATARLLDGAARGRFEHVAKHLAETADERALVRTVVDGYLAQGIAATGNRPDYSSDVTELHRLVDEDGNAVTDIEQVDAPYRLAYVRADFHERWTDTHGNPVDEELIDWSLDGEEDPDATVGEGMIDPRTLTRAEDVDSDTTWYVTDPEAAGLKIRTYGYRSAGSDPMPTDAEIDAQKEADRQARRQTIALNKKSEAALQVRREKIAEYLARKTLPKGAVGVVAEFLAATMWNNHDLFGYSRQDGNAKALTRQFLGGTEPVEAMAGASAERRHIVNLAIAIGAHEADMPKSAWRETDRGYTAHRATYLQMLVMVFGYTLSDVEEVITGDTTADEVSLD